MLQESPSWLGDFSEGSSLHPQKFNSLELLVLPGPNDLSPPGHVPSWLPRWIQACRLIQVPHPPFEEEVSMLLLRVGGSSRGGELFHSIRDDSFLQGPPCLSMGNL
ncbi:UNVERIFIED_CONTAM: hypothetical protein Sindi_1655600 [Sesamum indicum]